MIYELRTYRCLPGKVPAVLSRFQNHTIPLWERHGFRQAGFWTTSVGPSSNDLVYLLAWESFEEREKKMAAFMADPDWIAARASTEADGPLIGNVENVLLQPTAFSTVR